MHPIKITVTNRMSEVEADVRRRLEAAVGVAHHNLIRDVERRGALVQSLRRPDPALRPIVKHHHLR